MLARPSHPHNRGSLPVSLRHSRMTVKKNARSFQFQTRAISIFALNLTFVCQSKLITRSLLLSKLFLCHHSLSSVQRIRCNVLPFGLLMQTRMLSKRYCPHLILFALFSTIHLLLRKPRTSLRLSLYHLQMDSSYPCHCSKRVTRECAFADQNLFRKTGVALKNAQPHFTPHTLS